MGTAGFSGAAATGGPEEHEGSSRAGASAISSRRVITQCICTLAIPTFAAIAAHEILNASDPTSYAGAKSPGNRQRPQPGFRRCFHVLRARNQEGTLVPRDVSPCSVGHRDPQPEGHGRRVRSQRDLLSRIRLCCRQIFADGERIERGRWLRAHGGGDASRWSPKRSRAEKSPFPAR